MIDNYDSFVYNLVRYLQELGQEVVVYKNDDITLDIIKQLQPQGIIISPGPKTPKEAGMTLEIIDAFKGKIPILGICLGHQAIAVSFGGRIIQGACPMHGKLSKVFHDKKGFFSGLKQGIVVTRYHSLVVEKETLPECLEISSTSEEGVIMGLRHKTFLIEGVQFHPEAQLTELGHEMIQNFIDLCKRERNCCD